MFFFFLKKTLNQFKNNVADIFYYKNNYIYIIKF